MLQLVDAEECDRTAARGTWLGGEAYGPEAAVSVRGAGDVAAILPFRLGRQGARTETEPEETEPTADTSSVFERAEREIEELGGLYTFVDRHAIVGFLLAHGGLAGPLLEAHRRLAKLFGDRALEFRLEYDEDPEEDYAGLTAVVRTDLEPDQGLDLLDCFEDEWWLDLDFEVRSLVGVMVRPS